MGIGVHTQACLISEPSCCYLEFFFEAQAHFWALRLGGCWLREFPSPDFPIFPAHMAFFSKGLKERRAGVFIPEPSALRALAVLQGRVADGDRDQPARACLSERPAQEDMPCGQEPLLKPALWSWGCLASTFDKPSFLKVPHCGNAGGSVRPQLLPPASPSPFRNLSDGSIPV